MKINAELVTRLRNEKSWSQEELAITSGLNLRTIQRIEKEASASLQSKKALASALDIDIHKLDFEENPMKSCTECGSENTYRFKKYIDAEGGHGPDLLPKLAPSTFTSAKFVPVVCGDCGSVKFYASEEARIKLKNSEHWERV